MGRHAIVHRKNRKWVSEIIIFLHIMGERFWLMVALMSIMSFIHSHDFRIDSFFFFVFKFKM